MNDPGEWATQINGLHDAVQCMPDGMVELTVVQFAYSLPDHARTEIEHKVIANSNRAAVADMVDGIVKGSGITPMEYGIDLAVEELRSSPLFDSTLWSKVIYISSDVGEYTLDWLAIPVARDNAVLYVDEINAIGIGDIRSVDIDWLQRKIVYPQDGNIAPPFNPGWVYDVGIDAAKWTQAICQRFGQ